MVEGVEVEVELRMLATCDLLLASCFLRLASCSHDNSATILHRITLPVVMALRQPLQESDERTISPGSCDLSK